MSGNTTVNIISDIEETSPAIINQWEEFGGEGYYLTIKPFGESRTIQGNFTENGVIVLNSADRVIIDGELNEGERNLHIVNNAIEGTSCAVFLIGNSAGEGCTNVTIRNCEIAGNDRTINNSMGIVLGGLSFDVTPTGYDHDNCLIENNKFRKLFHSGVNAYASSLGNYDNLQILNNEFGDDDLNESLGKCGINLYYCPGAIIDGNHIHNLGQFNSTSYCTGLAVGPGNGNSIITNNRIHTLWHTTYTRGGAHGINISSSDGNDNILIANNAIYDLLTTNYSPTNTGTNPFGIRITGGTNISILHNSIHLYGTQQEGTGGYTNGTLSACIIFTASDASGLHIRNNTLSNTLVGLEGSTPTCIYHAGNNSVFTNIDYNNYYINELNAGYIGKLSGTWYQTFPEWQAATLQDANSINVFPDFTANDNLMPNQGSLLIEEGFYIESLPFDILGNPRNNPPTIGAYEVELGDDLPPPQLISPENSSIGNPLLPEFNWNTVDGATSYYIQIATDIDFSSIISEQSVPTNSFTATTSLEESTLYYWRAKGEAEGAIGYWSQVWTFWTTGPIVPVTLLTPVNEAIGVNLLPSFTWEYLVEARYYEFELATDIEFTDIFYSTIAIENTSFQIPAEYQLSNITNYYWRVRGYTGDNFGEWSDVWSFTTMSIVNVFSYLFLEEDYDYVEFTDGFLTNVTGNDAGANFDLPFTFSYAGIEFSQLRICTNGWVGLGEITHNASGNDMASTTYLRLLAPLWDDLYVPSGTGDITYRYEGVYPNRVFAIQYRNVYHNSGSSDAVNFQVRIYESNGLITFNYGPMAATYTGWNSTIGINGLVGGEMDFISVTPEMPSTASSTVSNNSINAATIATLSNKKFSFYPMGDYITLLSPVNKTLTEADVTLSWESIEGATSYQLMVSNSPDFLTTIIDNDAITSTSYELEDLNPITMHYWKVRALVDGQYTYWSKTWRFITAGPLAAPVVIAPANGSLGIHENINFTWSSILTASDYQIQVADDLDFNTLVLDQSTTETNFTWELEMNSYYYWRVRASNFAFTSPWSEACQFSTGSNFVIGDGTLSNSTEYYPAPYGNFYWGAKHQILVLASEILEVGGLPGYLTSLSFNVATLNTTAALVNFEIKLKQTTDNVLEAIWETEGFTTVYLNPSLINNLGWNTHQFISPFPWDGVSNILIDVCFNSNSCTDNQSTYYTTTTYNSVRYDRNDNLTVCTSPETTILSMNRPNMMFSGGPNEPPPMAPILTLPYNGSNTVSLNPTLVWSDIEEAENYRVQLATNSSFDNLLVNELTPDNDYLVGITLDFSTEYWWRVRSVTALGTQGPWSSIWSFTTHPNIPWEVVEQTGNSSSIFIQTSINPLLGDRPFLDDDAIGLFYQNDENEWACAGYGVWNGEDMIITVWGDNPDTPIKDGFSVEETYTFKVWDAVLGQEWNATATYQTGESFYTINGFSVLAALNVNIPSNQNISLNSGWNIISSYILPENSAITNVFENIVSDVKIVKNGIGQMYDPAFNINTIGIWNYADGYLVNMLNDNELTITGTKLLPEETPINLNNGWNLSAYLRDNEMSPTAALASISPSLVLAKDNAGGIFSPSFGINTLGNMQAGQGYYFYMNAASILTYPANSTQKAVAGEEITPLAKYNIPTMKNTGSNATLLISIESNDGNEIGVYNMNDELIGAGAVYNGVSAITIWGDDEATQNVDGAKDNEYLNVKLYNATNNTSKEISLSQIKEITGNTEQNELYYKTNAIYVAKASTNNESGFAMSIKNIPNPVESNVVFEFTLTDESNAEIQVYTSTGELIASIGNKIYSAGIHRIDFDASNLANGMYNIVLSSGSKKVSSFMIVGK